MASELSRPCLLELLMISSVHSMQSLFDLILDGPRVVRRIRGILNPVLPAFFCGRAHLLQRFPVIIGDGPAGAWSNR